MSTTIGTGPTNHHTHCYLCDGAGKPVEYLDVALERGFSILGFTSHAPLPFPVDWVMDEANLPLYVEEVEKAKRRAAGKIVVYTALEIDFIPDMIAPDPAAFPGVPLEYTIGSVHFVRDPRGVCRPIDGSAELFRESLDEGFGGDAKALVGGYCDGLKQMLSGYTPEILGHIDVIRKTNAGNRFFDTSESWYRREFESVIDAAAKNGCVVEVNTGAVARKKGPMYPEPWIVEKLREKNIRMMVNSDAHAPDQLGAEYKAAFALLRSSGYREYWILTDDGWKSREIAA